MKKIISLIIIIFLNINCYAQYWQTNADPNLTNARSMVADNQGNVWVATNGSGFSRFSETSVTSTYNTSNSLLPNNNCWAIAIDNQNNVWIGTTGGLAKLNTNNNTISAISIGALSPLVRSLFVDQSGYIWVGTSPGANPTSGIVKIDPSNNSVVNTFTSVASITNPNVRSICEDNNGNMWFGMAVTGSTGGGLAKYNGTFQLYTTATGLINDNVYALKKEANGNLWIGTNAGVAYWNGSNFSSYTTSSGLYSNQTWSIAIDNYNNKWFGGSSANGGATLFNTTNNTFQTFSTANGLSNNQIWSVCVASNGKKYFGTIGNLCTYQDNVYKPNPFVILSSGSLQTGQILTFSGIDFTPNNFIKIHIENKNNDVVLDVSIPSNVNGTLNSPFTISSSLLEGIHRVEITDLATNYTINRGFYVNNAPTPIPHLSIYEPDNLTVGKANEPILIRWHDDGSGVINSNNTAVSVKIFNIEYSFNNGGFQLLQQVIKPSNAFITNDYTHSFIPYADGQYKIKITEVTNTSNTDETDNFNINSYLNNGYHVKREWDYSGNRPNIIPKGVVADGVSRFYFKVSPNIGNNATISSVQINLNDPNGTLQVKRLLGKIAVANVTDLYDLEANSASQISITNSTPDANGNFWFWYVAPDDFLRNNTDSFLSKRTINAEVIVNYTNGIPASQTSNENIEIVRPPLMMVHGLNGDEHTWDNAKFSINTVKYKFKNSELFKNSEISFVKLAPDGSFDDNAKSLLNIGYSNGNFHKSSFQYQLNEMKNKGYACNMVDYVCHSMGGCMARTAINKYPNEFKPDTNSSTYYKNYDSGYIHKLITVNTPHNGSPLAEYVAEIVPYLPYHCRGLLDLAYPYAYNYIRQTGTTSLFWGSTSVNNYGPSPALVDMQCKNAGVRFNQTNVRNHLIGAESANGFYDRSGALTGWFIAGALTNLFLHADFVAYSTLKGYPNYLNNSDIIVPTLSQFANKPLQNLGSDNTLYINSTYWHVNITDQLEVGNKILSLLNSSVYSNSFSNSIPANTTPNGVQYKKTRSISDSLIEYADTTKIKILPLMVNSISPDSILTIKLLVKDTINLKSIDLTFQSEAYSSNLKNDTIIFNLAINPIFIDTQKIVVGARYDSLGFKVYHYDMTSILINTTSPVTKIIVSPKTKLLSSQEQYIPELKAVHQNFITTINHNNVELIKTIADTNVIQFHSNINRFIAKDSGSTYIVFSYRGFSDTIYIYVNYVENNTQIPLPIELSLNPIVLENCKPILRWNYPTDNKGTFIIQKSIDGKKYITLSEIKSTSSSFYEYQDKEMTSDKLYYRLLYKDLDNNVNISNSQLVINNCEFSSKINIHPNPTTKELNIELLNSKHSIKTIEILNSNGSSLNTIIYPKDKQSNFINIDVQNLSSGLYFINVKLTNGTIETLKFNKL